MFRNARKRSERRGFPIMGYCGANGGGKSAAMVWDTLPSLEAGRPVLSTVRLLDYLNPRECEGCDAPGHERPEYGPVIVEDLSSASLDEHSRQRLYLVAQVEDGRPLDDLDDSERQVLVDAPRVVVDDHGFPLRQVLGHVIHRQAHPLWVPFTEWEQLLDARSCDILMDEVTGVASSRESMGMPAPVANKLVQLRRADVIVRWSAPAWARADKIIRETSQAVTYCEGKLPKRSTGSGDRMWRQRRMFRWKTYDADDFEDFTSSKRDTINSLTRDWHWGPGSPSFAAYDTFDAVSTIGTVSDAGSCYRCGGVRRRPACSCPSSAPTTSRAGEGARQAGGQRARTATRAGVLDDPTSQHATSHPREHLPALVLAGSGDSSTVAAADGAE